MRWTHLLAAVLGAAVVAAAGSIAWASIPDAGGVIHGCFDTSTGALRVIDTDRGDTCSQSEQSLDWNQRGPSAPVLGARVNEDGRLLLGSGVLDVRHLAIGEYQVQFRLDIASCYMSLVANGHPGEVAGEPDPRDGSVVDVETFDSRGRPADGTFYLVATCPAG
jgi:hypothetical protein